MLPRQENERSRRILFQNHFQVVVEARLVLRKSLRTKINRSCFGQSELRACCVNSSFPDKRRGVGIQEDQPLRIVLPRRLGFELRRGNKIIDVRNAARAVRTERNALDRGGPGERQKVIENPAADFPMIKKITPRFPHRFDGPVEGRRQTYKDDIVTIDGFPALFGDKPRTEKKDFKTMRVEMFEQVPVGAAKDVCEEKPAKKGGRISPSTPDSTCRNAGD